jgi:hypothetical protein
VWIVTRFGVFSVSRRNGAVHLTVSARDAAELDALRAQHLSGLSETKSSDDDAEFPFHAHVSPWDFAQGMRGIALDIDYENFDGAAAENEAPRSRAAALALKKLTGGPDVGNG